MNTNQEGGVILADLLNLGMPLGLTVLAAQKKKSEKKEDTKNSQSGGNILSNNLLLEFGLSVVPFGLISLIDMDGNDKKKVKTTKKNNKRNIKK